MTTSRPAQGRADPAPEGPTPWTAAPFVPAEGDLEALAAAAAGCRGCPLYEPATQTVFGHGPPGARLVLVGEQPGDQEDRQGSPFVGPAGVVLRRCLEAAGVHAEGIYLTNAVKHFKFEQRGKRRIHLKPNAAEIGACHPWLAAELAAQPGALVVALGAVPARGLFGRTVGIAAARGQVHTAAGRHVVVTYHPSSVLRADDQRVERERELTEDLRWAWSLATP